MLGAVLPEHALLLDARRLGVALDHDQPHAGRPGARRAPPARRARPGACRSSPPGRGHARRGRSPSGSPPSARGRSAPSRRGRRRSRCAGRRPWSAARGRGSSTSRGTSAASPRAPAGAAGRRRGSRCWGSARSSRSCSAVPSAPAPGRSVHPWSSQRSTLQRRKCQQSVVRWLSHRGTGSAAAPGRAPTASRRRRRASPPARAVATGRGAAASPSRSWRPRGRRGRSRCCC